MKKRARLTHRPIKVKTGVDVIDKATGEIYTVNQIDIANRDLNFHKIWLAHILQSLDAIGNKKIKIALFIIDNLTTENMFVQTQRDVAKKLNVSTKTVNETFQILVECNFLKKKGAIYLVNPNHIFKGGNGTRMSVLLNYNSVDDNKKTSADTDDFKEKI